MAISHDTRKDGRGEAHQPQEAIQSSGHRLPFSQGTWSSKIPGWVLDIVLWQVNQQISTAGKDAKCHNKKGFSTHEVAPARRSRRISQPQRSTPPSRPPAGFDRQHVEGM